MEIADEKTTSGKAQRILGDAAHTYEFTNRRKPRVAGKNAAEIKPAVIGGRVARVAFATPNATGLLTPEALLNREREIPSTENEALVATLRVAFGPSLALGGTESSRPAEESP